MLPILQPDEIKQPRKSLIVEKHEENKHPVMGATQDLGSYLKKKLGEIPEVLFPNSDCSGSVKDIRLQRNDLFDSYDCVTSAHEGAIDTLDNRLLNCLPLQSRRYIALKSGTKAGQGNSNYNVQQAILKWGLIPEVKCPSMSDTMTQDQFYTPLDSSLDQYEDFKNVYDIQFCAVPTVDGKSAGHTYLYDILAYSPVVVSVNGNYQFDDQGRVIRADDSDSHDVYVVAVTPDYYLILDSENPNGFIKFAPDYQLHYPTFIYLKKKYMPEIYKKKTEAAIYALNQEDKVLVPFSDGVIVGGKLFKTLYGVDDYHLIPRVKDANGDDWDELPYPVAAYSFLTK